MFKFFLLKNVNLMQEVGRLRELTFREAGAGFGKKLILMIMI